MTGTAEKEHGKLEVYKRLEQLVCEMNYTVDAVVVEGVHDEKTLRVLSYKNAVLTTSRHSYAGLVELVSKRFSNIVILTDLDEQGIHLNRRLSDLFEEKGIRVDRSYRAEFQKLLEKANVQAIEGIHRLKLDLFP